MTDESATHVNAAVGQRVAVSDLTGPRPETDGLFFEMTGRCDLKLWDVDQTDICLSGRREENQTLQGLKKIKDVLSSFSRHLISEFTDRTG